MNNSEKKTFNATEAASQKSVTWTYKISMHLFAIIANLIMCIPALMYFYMLYVPRKESGTWDDITDELVLVSLSTLVVILTIRGLTLNVKRIYIYFSERKALATITLKRLKKIEKHALLSHSFGLIVGLMFIGLITKASFFNEESAQSVEIMEDVIVFKGERIVPFTPLFFEWQLWQHKGDLSRAGVTGVGGATNAAYYIRHRLQNEGIEETIAYGGTCYSSCTILWTSGKKRSFQSNTVLGFHQTCGQDKTNCQTHSHLYEGFLNEELISIIASPNGNNLCLLRENEVNILEGTASPEKDQLISAITQKCGLDSGYSREEIKTFSGYENVSI